MYRRVLVLLLAAVFFLGGCTVLWNTLKKTEAQKMEIRETEIIEQSPDMSGEESMYMDTTENVIYLAGGCFWGSVFQNQDFFQFLGAEYEKEQTLLSLRGFILKQGK